MKYILDTNTLSWLMAGEAGVIEHLSRHVRTDVQVPQPVVAEVAYGLARMVESARRERLRQRLAIYLAELPRAHWTDAVSEAFGAIRAQLERDRMAIEDFDVAIAAHAVAVEATLVTDNLKHMKRIRGLNVVNWRTRTPS